MSSPKHRFAVSLLFAILTLRICVSHLENTSQIRYFINQSHGITMSLPPPPPPPFSGGPSSSTASKSPAVAQTGPPGAFLVELLVFNGSPFKDHWAYFVRSRLNPQVGVYIHATGNVQEGFTFQVKRSLDFEKTSTKPTSRIPLQWVDGIFFDEGAMLNHGVHTISYTPACGFEASAYKVPVPAKSLNAADSKGGPKKRVVQRDCQTWIVESSQQLVADRIFNPETSAFLKSFSQ